MNRLIDIYLKNWRENQHRKPLLLRGARQVGKTFAARNLGTSFENFVEINLEQQPRIAKLFDTDLDAERIIRDLELLLKKKIIAGRTLLFFDEIQETPKAISALRYFYEQIPELHILAAGSLLEFQIESTGLPVGRVQSLFMYPVTFLEFLAARGEKAMIRFLSELSSSMAVSEPVHEKLILLWGEYMAIGGMPEAVKLWCERQSFDTVGAVHRSIVETYSQDFEKYAKKGHAHYLTMMLGKIPWIQGHKFKFTHISDSLKKRELAPALDLLVKAGVVHKVVHSAAQGLPLGAQADPEKFKLFFVDVGLSQTMLGPGQEGWILDPLNACVNKGELAEAFVAQELRAYADPDMHASIYYWLRDARSSKAEVDFVTILNKSVVPVEVKSGATGSMKSLHLFLKEHKSSKFGLRFYTGLPEINENIRSYPLYCIPMIFLKGKVVGDFIELTSAE